MRIAQGRNCLQYNDVLELVSEEALLEHYLGVTQIPCVIRSPLREDKSPSFGLYYSNHGICYTDFAYKDVWGYLPKLFRQLFNLEETHEVITKIMSDLESIKALDKYIIKKDSFLESKRNNKKSLVKTSSVLNVKIRDWEEHDLKYWSKSGSSKEWLVFGNVFPISHIQLNKRTFRAEKHAYCYVEHKDNNTTIKIYQPFSKRIKWLNNHDSSVWDLWEQAMASDSEELIITSSRKDALCLWENIGIPSVSLQAESYLPKPHVIEQLQNKFKTIYCLYDNDYDKKINYGKEFGEKLSKLYNIIQVLIPSFYLSKDPSDLFENVGKEKFKQIISQILKK